MIMEWQRCIGYEMYIPGGHNGYKYNNHLVLRQSSHVHILLV